MGPDAVQRRATEALYTLATVREVACAEPGTEDVFYLCAGRSPSPISAPQLASSSLAATCAPAALRISYDGTWRGSSAACGLAGGSAALAYACARCFAAAGGCHAAAYAPDAAEVSALSASLHAAQRRRQPLRYIWGSMCRGLRGGGTWARTTSAG